MNNKNNNLNSLNMLMEVAQLLHTSQTLEQLLDISLTEAMLAVGAEAGTLWLSDSVKNGYIYPAIAQGPKATALKGLKLRMGEGMAGWVTENRRSQLVCDVSKDPLWAKRFDKQTGFETRTLLCVPLSTRTSCIGCLQLVNKKDKQLFNANDLKLCEAVAGIITIAIENNRLYTNLKTMFNSFLVTLASALDARDPYTRGHSERVSKYSLIIGKGIGLSSKELEVLERASLLHDIGKLGVRDDILLKESGLNDEEYEIMKRHSEIGCRILQDIDPPQLIEQICLGAACHHERYDGKGYPQGIKGDDIPLLARIIAVADSFDAMTTDRPYRKGLTIDIALKELLRCSGTQFDPTLVNALVMELEKGKSNMLIDCCDVRLSADMYNLGTVESKVK